MQLFRIFCLLQLMEKAENREKERLKEETKKVVMLSVLKTVLQSI